MFENVCVFTSVCVSHGFILTLLFLYSGLFLFVLFYQFIKFFDASLFPNMRGQEDLGRVRAWKTIIRIYCIKNQISPPSVVRNSH